ncbi:aminoglycoside phosphotransferase [Nesterenkonia salmonea]|uniref:Aminoglycoside phosphotransferase n=2 Tax=Nesterenkonia salmonea TaxID=1804987 RepID=A0A5R9B8H9_9MICC|nr:aminoglycoside phosphotransferase [Nesterenkonia salmonea]
MELAALATRAVPGLSPTGVADAPDDARDFMSAVVVDGSGNRWRVRGPQHQQAAMRLETEVQVLRGFSTAIRAELPFRVPSVAGATRVEDMRVFVYNHLPGEPVELPDLVRASPELIEDLGRTMAAVHDLSETVVDHADLPGYSAERVRQRRLNELDAAASTGQVPPLLLRRWERAMEDKALWDFAPTVVHGDLHEDNLLIEGERVMAVTGWTDLHVGDPADDLAWLIASPEQTFSDRVLAAYTAQRRTAPDEHVLRRAALSAEFALAQWMIRGTTGGNEQMVEEATGLLKQLASDIETYGGRPIALDPPEEDKPQAPADTQDSKPVRRAGAAATIAGAGAWDASDDDGEPAFITDADVAEADPSDGAAEQETGVVTPVPAHAAPRPVATQRTASDDDPLTEEIPAYVDDAGEFDLPAPVTGSLPIQPDHDSERRAKQKNFFPSSAASAASARSASSSASSSSASSAISSASAQSAPSAVSAASGASAEPVGSAAESAASPAEASSSSIYERHPGLRPPGS